MNQLNIGVPYVSWLASAFLACFFKTAVSHKDKLPSQLHFHSPVNEKAHHWVVIAPFLIEKCRSVWCFSAVNTHLTYASLILNYVLLIICFFSTINLVWACQVHMQAVRCWLHVLTLRHVAWVVWHHGPAESWGSRNCLCVLQGSEVWCLVWKWRRHSPESPNSVRHNQRRT